MFKKIASNTLSQIISKALTAFISIFLISLLTTYLSVEMYGAYNKIYNYLWIFAFLADLWLYTIMVREISSSKESPQKIVGNVLTLRALLWSAIILLALWLALLLPWYDTEIMMWCITIVWIFTFLSLINSSLLALMQSQLKMEFSLLSVVTGKLITLWFIWGYFLFFTKNEILDLWMESLYLVFVWGVIWIWANTLMNYWYARKICPILFQFDWKYITHIFKISLPYWIALFLSVVYFKIDIIILSIMEWDSANTSIALYSLPMKIVEVLMVLWWFYLNSILPKLSQLFKNVSQSTWSREEIQSILSVSYKVLFAFWVFIATFWIVFREHIIRIIANSSYLEWANHIYNSSDVMLIVLLILVVYFISLLYIYIFIAAKKQSLLLKINIIITLVNIVWNILLIPYFSFIWAAYVTLFSQILLVLLANYFSKSIVSFSFPKIFSLKIILLSLSSFSLVYFLVEHNHLGHILDLIVYGGMVGMIYIGVSYILIKKSFNQ